jgi:hypothetical protein
VVRVEGLHVLNKAGTDRIKVDVAHQFQEVRLLVAQNRFVSVLKEMARSSVTPVMGDGVSGKEATHHLGDRNEAGLQKQMKMVGQKHPGITAGACLSENGRKTVDEIIPVPTVSKDDRPVYASSHDVVEGAGGVNTGLTGHILVIGKKLEN